MLRRSTLQPGNSYKFGAHTACFMGGEFRLENVEFTRTGQAANMGPSDTACLKLILTLARSTAVPTAAAASCMTTTTASHRHRHRPLSHCTFNTQFLRAAGRYSSHLHLLSPGRNVDTFKSYIRNNSYHQTFQRAVTIHSTDHAVARDNVAYQVRIGCRFCEGGGLMRVYIYIIYIHGHAHAGCTSTYIIIRLLFL